MGNLKAPATILVVEDRPTDRELMVMVLHHGGYRVVEAGDGLRALERVQREHPDLVISDVLLPKLDGYEMVRQLRADPATAGTKVIFYTAAFNEREARDLARDCGVSLILAKPTEPREILEQVAKVLKSKRPEAGSSPLAAFDLKHQVLLRQKLIDQLEALHRNEERLERQAKVLAAINQVFHKALTCKTEEELGRVCLTVAEELTGSRGSFMGRINPETGRLQGVVLSDTAKAACRTRQPEPILPEGLRLPATIAKLVRDRRAVIDNDTASHPDLVGFPLGYLPVSAFLGVPLMHAGLVMGVLGLANKEGGYDATDGETIEALAAVIVETLLRKQGEAALTQAHHDLEHQVEERTAKLQEALAQLEEEMRERLRAEESLKESEERLRFLTSQLLNAQERERKRIAYELHDDLGQALMVLKMKIHSFKKRLSGDQQALQDDCDQTLQYVDGVVQNVRNLSHDLSPPRLEDLGLAAALDLLLDNFARHQDIEVALNLDEVEGAFSTEQQIVIYRVFQESLNNIAKHAEATRMAVTITKHFGHVDFQIMDNGRGFEPQKVLAANGPRHGLGLTAMDERIRMLGGSLRIDSRPGQGTRIAFIVPSEISQTSN